MSIVKNIQSIKNVFGEIKTTMKNKGIAVADGVPVTVYPSLITNIVTANDRNFACYEINGATSLTGTIHAEAGDIVLATITARSAMTLPDSLTLLNTSDPIVGADGATQTMTFAYQKITEAGDYEYTINQAAAGRLYLNLIAVRGAKDIKYTGKYCTAVSGVSSVTAPPKTNGELLIWGCSSVYWSTSVPYGSWTSTLPQGSIGLNGNATQPRQANFLDFDGEGERMFTAALTDAIGTAIVVDAVELILSDGETTDIHNIKETANVVKQVFADIKTALESKGVTVADGTPVTEYAVLIRGIDTAPQTFKNGDVIEGVTITNVSFASEYCDYFVINNTIFFTNYTNWYYDGWKYLCGEPQVYYRTSWSSFLEDGDLSGGISSNSTAAAGISWACPEIISASFDIYDVSGNLFYDAK